VCGGPPPWGTLHTIIFRHPFADIPGLRAISSPGPFAAPGDGTTVSMGEYDMRGSFEVRVATAFRHVMPAGAPAEARAVMPPGQSGDPTSRHYRDQIALYLQGDDRPASWDEGDFLSSQHPRLKLVPE
jgi:penicillin amidase